MNEQHIRELAEHLRNHLARDGSFYAFEEVICSYLKRRSLLDDKTLTVSFFPPRKPSTTPNFFGHRTYFDVRKQS